jgi:hypothetical protein
MCPLKGGTLCSSTFFYKRETVFFLISEDCLMLQDPASSISLFTPTPLHLNRFFLRQFEVVLKKIFNKNKKKIFSINKHIENNYHFNYNN